MRNTSLLALGLLAVLLSRPGFFWADEPTPPLTPAQQQQLKERDRWAAETKKLRQQGKLAEAIAACEKMLAIERDVLGNVHANVANSLEQLAKMQEEQADFEAAKKARQEVLAIRRKLNGDKHWRVTDARLALALLEKLVQLTPEERRQLEQAKRLDDEERALYRQSKYQEAVPLRRKILAIHQKVFGPEHPYTALSLNNLGLLLQEQGDYAAARPYVEQALAFYKKVLGPEHPHTATSLNNLGFLLKAQGDYAGARPYYEQALAIYKKVLGSEHHHTATSLNNLGLLLQAQGDYAGARPYYEQALAIRKKVLGPEHPHTALCLNNLGLLLRAQAIYAGARPYLEQALAINKKVLGPEHPNTAGSLGNLGVLLFEQGDYEGARPYLEQALAIRKKVLGPEHPKTVLSLSNLGALLQAQGDSTGARPYCEQALAITIKNLLLASAGLSERQQLAQTRTLRHHLDAYLALAPRARLAADKAYQPLLRWKGAILAHQQLQRLGRADAATQALVVQLQSVTSRLAKLAWAVPEPKQRDAWRRQLQDLSREKDQVEADLSRSSAAFLEIQDLQTLTPAQLQQALPLGTVLVDFLEFTHWDPPPGGKGKLRAERRLAAFVVRRDRPIVQLDLGPLAPIAAAVDAWRQGVAAGAAPAPGDAAAELRRRVWAPLEPHLPDATTVLLSPDGALARLPFAALPGKQPGTYLIEERALAVVPVPQLLPALLKHDPAQAKAASLLLVGDVDYGARPGTGEPVADVRSAPRGDRPNLLRQWEPLPSTRAEIVALKDSFQERFPDAAVTVLRKSKATEAAVRTQAPAHRHLHLATHGFFAPKELKSALAFSRADQPQAADLFRQQDVTGFHPGLLSGLVLAGANQMVEPGRDDGILTSLEIATLDLSGVDLAVLSACETGLGESAGGEGLLGVQRAFQMAGAKSVVASLWKVDDTATRLLMTRFYENLWNAKKPMSKLEALRQAQLWLLREGSQRGLKEMPVDPQKVAEAKPEGQRSSPFFWAGFVLSGDWR
jgi:CHAT domain-containing protein